MWQALQPILPVTARIDSRNHLELGGVDMINLVYKYGTPLYVFDEETLRRQCVSFVHEFWTRYPQLRVIYASKAFLNRNLLPILYAEGLGLDVASGGELAVAEAAKFPMELVYFHGNNKSRDELLQALKAKIGTVVVDNFHELNVLNEVATEQKLKQNILLRISPGVDSHTHAHTTTGITDSKFGFTLVNGQAEEAVRQATQASNLTLTGLHIHLGSPLFETAPYREGIEVTFDFAAQMRDRYGMKLLEFSPGGGFPIQYTTDNAPPPLSEYAAVITMAVTESAKRHRFDLPRLVIEPGRAIVGRAGVALYTVGAIKDIPGVRKYVSVDGGMGDNIRPAIYGSKYEAVVASKIEAREHEKITIAGKYCESGDVLIKDAELPVVKAGDVIALPASGAYCIPMSSTYNSNPRPPVVAVRNGTATLWARRETYADLVEREVIEASATNNSHGQPAKQVEQHR